MLDEEKKFIWKIFTDLSFSKERLIDEVNIDKYVPYLINRSFSNFLDTIFDANEINRNSNLDNLIQYEYYFNAVKKRKRYKPWDKPVVTADQKAVAAYYDYNLTRAAEVLPLLNPEQLKVIKKYAESLKQINTSERV